MDNKIISKFTVATEEGVDTLLFLTNAIAREKFGSVTTNKVLDQYIGDHFNRKSLVSELNSLSNQWVVVYYNNEPAGYARITSTGKRPQALAQKRVMRLADFGVLKKYNDPRIPESLLYKCLSVCHNYDGVWIDEYVEDQLLTFFEGHGFLRLQEAASQHELSLPALYLFRESHQ